MTRQSGIYCLSVLNREDLVRVTRGSLKGGGEALESRTVEA
jgi:hypothetical protein